MQWPNEKAQTMIYTTLQKDRATQISSKQGVNSGAPERFPGSALLMSTVVRVTVYYLPCFHSFDVSCSLKRNINSLFKF